MDTYENNNRRPKVEMHVTSWERQVGRVVVAPVEDQERNFQVDRIDSRAAPSSAAWMASDRQIFYTPTGAQSVHLNSEALRSTCVYGEGVARPMLYEDDCRQRDGIFQSVPRRHFYEETISIGHSNVSAHRDGTFVPTHRRDDAPESRRLAPENAREAISVVKRRASLGREAALSQQSQFEDDTGSMSAQYKGAPPVRRRQPSPDWELAPSQQRHQYGGEGGYMAMQFGAAPLLRRRHPSPVREPAPFQQRQEYHEESDYMAAQFREAPMVRKRHPSPVREPAPFQQRQEYHEESDYMAAQFREAPMVRKRHPSPVREPAPFQQRQQYDEESESDYMAAQFGEAPMVRKHHPSPVREPGPSQQRQQYDDESSHMAAQSREKLPVRRRQPSPGWEPAPPQERQQDDDESSRFSAQSREILPVRRRQPSPGWEPAPPQERQQDDDESSRFSAQSRENLPVRRRQPSPGWEPGPSQERQQYDDERGRMAAQSRETLPVRNHHPLPKREVAQSQQRQDKDVEGDSAYMATQYRGPLPGPRRHPSPGLEPAPSQQRQQYNEEGGYMAARSGQVVPVHSRHPFPEREAASDPSSAPGSNRYHNPNKAVVFTHLEKLPAICWYDESQDIEDKSSSRKRARAVLPMPPNSDDEAAVHGPAPVNKKRCAQKSRSRVLRMPPTSDEDEEAVDDPAPVKKKVAPKSRLTTRKDEGSTAPRPVLRNRPRKVSCEPVTDNQSSQKEENEGTKKEANAASPNSDETIVIYDSDDDEAMRSEEAPPFVISKQPSKGDFRGAAIASYLQDWECYHCDHTIDEFRPAGIVKTCKPHIDLIHYSCLLECVRKFERCPLCNVPAKVEDVQ